MRFQISAFLKKNFPAHEQVQLENKIDFITAHKNWALANIELKTFLRHYGFPSPLLDWSRSPYVAAFFAFRSQSNISEVAIFQYQEFCGNGKSLFENEPRIVSIGSNINTDKRHFTQQSEYTTCIQKQGKKYYYVSHENALLTSERIIQDKIVKYILPASIRAEVLYKLNLMNINSYTLFKSTESFMEMLAIQKLDCKQHSKRE